MGRHEKAPVRCPCSQLAALHGAPWTQGGLLNRGCNGGCLVGRGKPDWKGQT